MTSKPAICVAHHRRWREATPEVNSQREAGELGVERNDIPRDAELRRLPDEVLEALEKTSQEAVEDLVAGNDQARRIYESYRDFRDSVMPYIAVAEQSALNVRSTVLGQKAP